MAQAIIQPSRMRRAFNGWCKGLFAGQQFDSVLNLGCGHNVDRQGGTYDGYWMANRTFRVDISDKTTYPDYELMLCGGGEFRNPIHQIMNAEKLFYPNNSFDMVFCNWMIYHCDHVKVLDEIVRVLVPKGKLFVSWTCEKFSGDPIYAEIHNRFGLLACTYLHCDTDLDGRIGWAFAYWGEKR